MGPPGGRGNYRGYEEADLTSRAANFKDKNLLLIHGSADDNVHVQHSMVFSRALVKAGVTFRQQVSTQVSYSDKRCHFPTTGEYTGVTFRQQVSSHACHIPTTGEHTGVTFRQQVSHFDNFRAPRCHILTAGGLKGVTFRQQVSSEVSDFDNR